MGSRGQAAACPQCQNIELVGVGGPRKYFRSTEHWRNPVDAKPRNAQEPRRPPLEMAYRRCFLVFCPAFENLVLPRPRSPGAVSQLIGSQETVPQGRTLGKKYSWNGS